MKTKSISATPLQVQANRFDVLSRLADDLAHELKNPLHSMVISVELLKRRLGAGDTERALDRLRVIDDGIGRVNTIVDSLLQLLRPSRDGAGLAELDDGMMELMPLLELRARLSHATVVYEPAGSGTLIRVRRDAFKHAVLNLFSNALEALDGGARQIELRGCRTPDEIQLRVADSGPGIAADGLERAFEPGFTTRAGHTGLGLAVARTLIEEMGGRLEIEAGGGDGAGATLLLAVPVAMPA